MFKTKSGVTAAAGRTTEDWKNMLEMSKSNKRGSSLCAALRVCIDYELLSTKEIFQQLSDDCSFRLHSVGVGQARTDALNAAQRLINYINNYLYHNENNLTSETGLISLVAIDRARDHLRSALETVRLAGRHNFHSAQLAQELHCQAARYSVNQIIAVRAGDYHLAELWRDAGDLCVLLARSTAMSGHQILCPRVTRPVKLVEYDKKSGGEQLAGMWKTVASYERRVWVRKIIVALLTTFRDVLPSARVTALTRWHETRQGAESVVVNGLVSISAKTDDVVAMISQVGRNALLEKLYEKYFVGAVTYMEAQAANKLDKSSLEQSAVEVFRYGEACGDVVSAISKLVCAAQYLTASAYRREVEAALQTVLDSPLLSARTPVEFEAEVARLLELIEGLTRRQPAGLDVMQNCRLRLAAIDPTRSGAHAGAAKCWNKALECFAQVREATQSATNGAGGDSETCDPAQRLAVRFMDLADSTYADAMQYDERATEHAAAGRTIFADLWRQASDLVLRAAEDQYQRLADLAVDQTPVPVLTQNVTAIRLEMRASQFVRTAQATERGAPEAELRLYRALAELATIEGNSALTPEGFANEMIEGNCTRLLESVLDQHVSASHNAELLALLPVALRTESAPEETERKAAADAHLQWVSDTAVRAAGVWAKCLRSGGKVADVRDSLQAVLAQGSAAVGLIRMLSSDGWSLVDTELRRLQSATGLALTTAELMGQVGANSGPLLQEFQQLREKVARLQMYDVDLRDYPSIGQYFDAVLAELMLEVAKQANGAVEVTRPAPQCQSSVRGAVDGFVKKANCLQRASEAAAQGRTEEERLLRLAAAQYKRHIDCHFFYVRFLARKGNKSSKKTALIQDSLRGTLVACDLYLEAVELRTQGRVEASEMLARAAHYSEMNKDHADMFFRVSAAQLARANDIVARMRRTAGYFTKAARAFQQQSAEAQGEEQRAGRKRSREAEPPSQALAQAWRAAAEASEKWLEPPLFADVLLPFAICDVPEWLREHTLWLVRAAQALEEGRADEAEACASLAAEYAALEQTRLNEKKTAGAAGVKAKAAVKEQSEEAAAATARIEELRRCPALRGKKFMDSF